VTSRPIVVGTDGSQHALRAVEWAAREARGRGESLLIVSVPWAWPVSTPPGTFVFAVASEASDADHAAASMAVGVAGDRVGELFPGLRVEAEVIPGYPVQVLLRRAAEASMLVVGSRGAGGFAAMMLGSVSRCISTSSPCPAVIVGGEPLPVRGEIAVGVREPERAAAALRFGFEEAALHHSRLLAVHAWGSPSLLENTVQRRIDPVTATAIAAEQLHALLAEWAKEYPEVDSRADIVQGHPGRVLSEVSARADLVILGRHRVTDSDAPPVGSALHAVLGHAAGPVAIVPDH
jgi:nucleotide-binding universal stress UspA family protein